MKKTAIILGRVAALIGLALLVLVTTSQIMAQMQGSRPGRMMGRPMYDPSTEVKVSGTVAEVQELTGAGMPSDAVWMNCPRGWAGTHLNLSTDQGNLVVHVGPVAYLASKNFNVAKGDNLTIVGSKVKYQDSEFLIAREITKGTQVLTLRDPRGFPLWSGGRKGKPMPGPAGAN